MKRAEANNIKPSFLQFGDWIEFNSDSMEVIMNCCVVRADGECVYTDKTGADPIYEEEIFPIILEKKILEDNGFVYEPNSKEKDDGWWSYRKTDIPTEREYINIAFRNDNVSIYDLDILVGNNQMNLHLNFVHELQHALRLCGSKKEIII
jgi:hypothetical protein